MPASRSCMLRFCANGIPRPHKHPLTYTVIGEFGGLSHTRTIMMPRRLSLLSRASAYAKSCCNASLSSRFSSLPPSSSCLGHSKRNVASSTWRFQDSLPRLPVPPLQQTLDRYLALVTPLIPPKNRADTKEAVEWLSGSEGQRLQRELMELAEEVEHSSWLRGMWDTMYLEYRAPVVIHSNPYFSLSPLPIDKDQVTAASAVLASTARFIALLRAKELQPDMAGKDTALCMEQYRYLFGTARIPRPGRDVIESSSRARHISVILKNSFYAMDIFDTAHRPLSAAAIAEQIRTIYALSESNYDEAARYGGVGLLTAAHRDRWAAARQRLEAVGEENEDALETIDTSLLVLSLDDDAAGDLDQWARTLLHANNGRNRWFDKLSMVVAADGRVGFNMEHAPYDGHTLLRYMCDVWNDVSGDAAIPSVSDEDRDDTTTDVRGAIANPFRVNDDVVKDISAADEEITGLISRTHSSVLVFDDFGKRWIKSMKFSPDAFVQMAYQLAYQRRFGRTVSTYESCMTKGFLHGRTETIRSSHAEAAEFCRTMAELHPDGVSDTTDAEKAIAAYSALQKAVSAQVAQSKECARGNGVDRHLFGLHFLAKQALQRLPNYSIPDIFTDQSYATFSSNVLSTSNCGADQLDLFGFGPVNPNGLGVGYILKDDAITATVSSFDKPEDASGYADSVREAMRDMRTLHKQATSVSAQDVEKGATGKVDGA